MRFLFIGFLQVSIGFVMGYVVRLVQTRQRALRDSIVRTQVEKEYVRLGVGNADTETLLDELSTREFKVERHDD